MFETLKIFRVTLDTIRDYRVLALAVVLHIFFFFLRGWSGAGRGGIVLFCYLNSVVDEIRSNTARRKNICQHLSQSTMKSKQKDAFFKSV